MHGIPIFPYVFAIRVVDCYHIPYVTCTQHEYSVAARALTHVLNRFKSIAEWLTLALGVDARVFFQLDGIFHWLNLQDSRDLLTNCINRWHALVRIQPRALNYSQPIWNKFEVFCLVSSLLQRAKGNDVWLLLLGIPRFALKRMKWHDLGPLTF